MLGKLPDAVLSGISSAKSGLVGVECEIRDDFKTPQTIYIPNNVTQIKVFDGFIGIYCGEYFFRLSGKIAEKQINYMFVKMEQTQ